MSTFDPYHKWLGIPPAEQPPHHYRLLSVAPFESDLDVIEAAADRQMTYIRQCATGPYVKESQQILNELSAARVCLLNPSKKQAYDSELKSRIAPAPAPSAPESPLPELRRTDVGPALSKAADVMTPAEVAQQQRRVEKLFDEQNYDVAIPMLVKLAELEGTLFKDTAAWANSELPAAKQKQQKLRERVTAACAKARKLLETYNYGEASQMLDAIPAGARTEEVRELLSLAGTRFEDALDLQQEIEAAVRAKNYERLLPLVRRFLKLKPDNTKMQRLAQDLARNRPDRAVRHFKGTGKYFDVAGRLVEPKEIAGGLCFIVALVVGASYGVKYLHKQPAAGDLMSSSSPPPDVTPDRKDTPIDAPNRVPEPIGNTTDRIAAGKNAWSWSFDHQQAGRIPESSGAGFEAMLPMDAPPESNLASMTRGNSLEFRGSQRVEVDGAGKFGWKQPFSLAVWECARTNSNNHGALIAKMSDQPALPGYTLEYILGSFGIYVISDWQAPGGSSAIEARTLKIYEAGAWHHVIMTYDGSARIAGVKIYVDGVLEPMELRTDRLTGDIQNEKRLTFGSRGKNHLNFNGWLAEPRVYASCLTPEEAKQVFEQGPKPDSQATAIDDFGDASETVVETWTTVDDWLVSPADPVALLSLTDDVPAEYTVSLKVRRLTGKNAFALGIPIGKQQVLVALDAHAGTVSGLEFLDGKHVHDNAATYRGRLLLPDQVVTVLCTVRKNGITCTCDGVKVVDWRGDLGKLSLPPDFRVPDKKSLFLVAMGSRFAIREITLQGRRVKIPIPVSSADEASSGKRDDNVPKKTKASVGKKPATKTK